MEIKKIVPPVADFIALRADEGWGEITYETAHASLNASLISICAYEGETLVGFGRVIGDDQLYFYIQDFIIAPNYRGNGYGKQVLAHLIADVEARAAPGAMIGLMSAHGKDAFYKQFGFIARPNDTFGAGMIKLI